MNDRTKPPGSCPPDNVRDLRPGIRDDAANGERRKEHDGPVMDPESAGPGKLAGIRTFLEMTTDPRRTPRAPRVAQLSIMRARMPTVSFYRFLYNTVGEPWYWVDRRLMNDAALSEIIHDPLTAVYVLYHGGVPAGFVEFNLRDTQSIEIAYFGLMPEFIGQRLGPYLLDWAIAKGWSLEPDRLVLNTCTLDHPKAISVYQRAGFHPYAQEHYELDDPSLDGTLGFKPRD